MNESQEPTPDEIPICPFFKLPCELRLRIYEDLLVTEKPIPITLDTRSLSNIHNVHLQPQVLRTCPQLHDEAAGVLYGFNTFEILGQANGHFEMLLKKWLGRIGRSNVARLNRLKLSILVPLPTRNGLLYVDMAVRLRSPTFWRYIVKYQEDKEPCTAELEPDANVEEQLELVFRRKSITRKPWEISDLLSIYNAAMQIRPRVKNDAILETMPAEVWHFFDNGLRRRRTGSQS